MSYSEQLEITLTGKGETKELALANALSKLQQEINNKRQGTIIRIEPLEVNFIEGTEEKYIEKFLFLFWKRERTIFNLKVSVKVNVFIVDVDSFECVVVKKKGLL